MKPERDYYEVLGVERDADAKTIKRAFLKLARELHPDVSDAPDAEVRFKEVNEAYSVLSDERKRANYDRYGDADGLGGGFGADYVDMSDIFGGGFGVGDIFEQFFGGGAQAAGQTPRTRGRDMGIHLTVTLEEAATGCTKNVAYERLAPCDDCDATGSKSGAKARTCERCHGTGRVVETRRSIFGQTQSVSPCPDCGGLGKLVDDPCETCGGQGRTPAREVVEVEIPAGIRSGQTVTVWDKGEAGVRGDSTGNLVVSVEVAPHERFERSGDDLAVRIDVDALVAVVGGVVEVDGIFEGEKVEVEVPAGCQYGQQVKVSGKGMPRRNLSSRGDLIAVVAIEVPSDLTKKQMAAVRKLVDERAGA